MGRALEAAAKGGVLDDVVGGAGNARLASGGLAEEIERLRAELGEGDIAIGGATLAAEAAALGLIDEYRPLSTRCWLAVAFRSFPSASVGWISISSRAAL